MEKFDYSKHMYLMRYEVLSLLEQNIWTDLLFQLHPRMNEIVSKSHFKGQYICLICQKHRTAYVGASLKSLPKHFSVIYHTENMRKEGLSNVNNEILAIFSQSDENLEDYQTNKELDQKKETLLR